MKKQTKPEPLTPARVFEEIAKRNGQRDLGGKVQDPSRGAPKKGGK